MVASLRYLDTFVTLQESMEKERITKGCRLAIDLSEVTLVSQEVVEALAVAEANGIEPRDCPAYVREWVSRAKENHD
jgi:hypothetical protein